MGPDRQPNCIAFGDPQMCQHCGIISNGPIRKCKKCAIQVHESCLSLNNELCDLCFYDLDPMTRCMLCDREEEKEVDSCSRSRIPFVVVGFGRQYTEVPSDTHESWQDRGYARVTSDAIVTGLQNNPNTIFPVSMMQAQRSYVEVESMVHMVAEPIVVHSWCACVFTGVDVTHKAFCETLFDVMNSTASSEATCYLCAQESNLLYTIKDHKSRSHSIHPSCGVRHGMQRVLCPSGRFGMCAYGAYGLSGREVEDSGIKHELPRNLSGKAKRVDVDYPSKRPATEDRGGTSGEPLCGESDDDGANEGLELMECDMMKCKLDVQGKRIDELEEKFDTVLDIIRTLVPGDAMEAVLQSRQKLADEMLAQEANKPKIQALSE